MPKPMVGRGKTTTKKKMTAKNENFVKGFINGKFGEAYYPPKILFKKDIERYPGHFEHNAEILILGTGQCNMGEFEEEWREETDSHFYINGILLVNHYLETVYVEVNSIVSFNFVDAVLVCL
jgi:hypothetical protein